MLWHVCVLTIVPGAPTRPWGPSGPGRPCGGWNTHDHTHTHSFNMTAQLTDSYPGSCRPFTSRRARRAGNTLQEDMTWRQHRREHRQTWAKVRSVWFTCSPGGPASPFCPVSPGAPWKHHHNNTDFACVSNHAFCTRWVTKTLSL